MDLSKAFMAEEFIRHKWVKNMLKGTGYFLHFLSIVYKGDNVCNFLGPVVQSVVSLTSSLMVKMLTVLVSTISNSQVFLLKKL